MSLRNYSIALSIVIALVLQIMPMPAMADLYRPDWVLLVLSYWALALPNRVNIGVAFFTGLILDILLGTSMGVHSFALCLCIYVLAANHKRLRNYSVWQQSIIIGIITALYNLDIYFLLDYLWPVLSSMVIWPWLFWLLRKIRRQLRLN
jgi:rod shape-determining protein MreD